MFQTTNQRLDVSSKLRDGIRLLTYSHVIGNSVRRSLPPHRSYGTWIQPPYGGSLNKIGGFPNDIYFNEIFHEINHPAMGVPS